MSIAIEWSELERLPLAKAGAASGLVGSQLVLAGGVRWDRDVKVYLDGTAVFDIAAGHWQGGPALPQPLGYGPACVAGSDLVALGGTDGKRIVRECWRLVGGQWHQDGSFPEDGLNLARGVAAGGSIFVFAAGRNADANEQRNSSDGVYRRDAKLGESTWEKVATLPSGPTCVVALAVVGGDIYMFGGAYQAPGGAFINRDEAYCFDPASARWTKLRPLPQANRGAAAVALDDHRVLLLGGYVGADEKRAGGHDQDGFTAATWVYDVRTDRYEAGTPMPHPVLGLDAVITGGVVYGSGGEPPGHRVRSDRTIMGRLRA